MAAAGSQAMEMSQTLDALHEISRLVNAGVDKQTLAILVSLCEQGVNPEALAAVVLELRREAAGATNAPEKATP